MEIRRKEIMLLYIEIGRREDYGREQDGTKFANNIKRR